MGNGSWKNKIGRNRLYNSTFMEELGIPDVVHWEVLNIKKEQEFCIEFISTNSKYRQGIRLAVDAGKGYFEIDGENYGKDVYLLQDPSYKKVNIKCVSDEGLLSIYNVYDKGAGQGGIRSQMDYSGMLAEKTETGFRYRCNDVGLTDTFDSLVFEISLL